MDGFYADPAVQKRLIEFMGGDSLESATAIYITASDGRQYDQRSLYLPSELNALLEQGSDVCRSLADQDSLLLHLDIEYVNFDSPAEVYLDPGRTFELQEPVVRIIETLLLRWGIRPLHIITGQGHHFVWRIRRNDPLAAKLTQLGPAPELTGICHERVPSFLQGRITEEMQQAFGGIALLLEYVAHCIKADSAGQVEVPVEITAVHVGPSQAGKREMISIDISEYGDPLQTRMVRMPFSNYHKPGFKNITDDMGLHGSCPALRAIPLYEMDYRGALEVRKGDYEVRELARRACIRIPDQTEGTRVLLHEYEASRLKTFHEYFYSTRHDPRERWAYTYQQTPLALFPYCVRDILTQPNDRLLKPAGMQLITRTLMAHGWHPRHIAGFIRSIFENPQHGWGVNWQDYEAGTRADFYVRVFSGLYSTGLDRLVDFNCVSTLEKGFCTQPCDAGPCLEPLRHELINRQRL